MLLEYGGNTEVGGNRRGVKSLHVPWLASLSPSELNRQINEVIQTDPLPPLTVTIINDRPDRATVTLDGKGGIDYGFTYHEDDRRSGFFFVRAKSTVPLFAALVEAYPGLNGTCKIWIDDYAAEPGGLAFSGDPEQHTLIPDPHFLCSVGYRDWRYETMPWEERESKVFWRGNTSGIPRAPWYEIPRIAMCMKVKQLNRPELFDVKIVDKDYSDEAKAHCEEIAAAGILAGYVDTWTFSRYKYGIDIDGYGCAWSGLFTKMLYKNVVIKFQSAMKQWYYHHLKPWWNYVPVSEPGELLSVTKWLVSHDYKAKQIGERACHLACCLSFDGVIDAVLPSIKAHIEQNVAA